MLPLTKTPPTQKEFCSYSTFTSKFTKEEWLEHVNKCHEKEKAEFQSRLDRHDRIYLIVEIFIYISVIIIILFNYF